MAKITEKEQLIFDIAKIEWEMFQQVHNTEGRASCQDDPDTFFRMRMSQWMVYSKRLLYSYKEDCEQAMNAGKNLVFEKYAKMMETTYPEEYMAVKEYLPEKTIEEKEIIEKIIAIHIKWDQEVMEMYPNVRGRGRTFRTEEDNVITGSSMESYLRAEAGTYSWKTLQLLYRETKEAYKTGNNLLQQIVANETAFYGYESLEAAESKM